MTGSPEEPPPGLRLAELAREIPGDSELPPEAADVRVTGVRHDSREILPGELFVARRGRTADGARFASAAKERGAVAVIAARSDERASVGLPVLRVDDPQRALAFAAAAVYGHPSFSLDVVGITGTNGKTTSTHLVRAAVDGALGRASCGTIGTVGHAFAGRILEASHTTPEADELARLMATMRAQGASLVAMEVSSHALALGRVEAIRFRVAAFTNLTQDHLDFHGTLEAYGEAKARLFTELGPGAAVINVDDEAGAALARRVRSPLLRVRRSPTGEGDADVAPIRVEASEGGTIVVARTPSGVIEIRSRLLGAHNVENLMVTLGVIEALGLDVERAALALGREGGAPGRLERCDTPDDDIVVLVDYAHTPDALARALESVSLVKKGRVLCVFGCGGDRDPTKRAKMGSAVARGADVALVTSDNPRSEDPAKVASAVEEGVRSEGMPRLAEGDLGAAERGYLVELDRARAIRGAVLAARKDDIVLVAGKGHETYQIIGAARILFDDREEARRALAARRSAHGER